MTASPARSIPAPQVIHCAIYVRVSTDERLWQEFNSLHNQRESAENYIKAQAGEGWQVLPDTYEDPGVSGGTLDRPGLQALLADVKAGKIDRVIVYKIDRLTRSLLDFGRLAEVLDQYGASIVAVTQQFDTSTSMGRLTLNMLLSFAQFEREMIAERTSDKMAASRRKGKWVGGIPMLGYDVAPEGGKLLVNKIEATRVRQVFDMYLENRGLIPVVEELNRRGWTGKSWTTKKGRTRLGKVFTKTALHKLLTNWTYAGKVKYRDEVYEGEHDAIVAEDVFDSVQDLLQANCLNQSRGGRSGYQPLLSGLLYCTGCGVLMSHAPTTRRGKTYRYYRCRTAMTRGKNACTGGSISAPDLEQRVVDHIKAVGRDPEVVLATLEEAQRQVTAKKPMLKEEATALRAEVAQHRQEIRRLVDLVAGGDEVAEAARGPLAELQDILYKKEARLREIRSELAALKNATVNEADLRNALGLFDPVWDALFPPERRRVLHLLIGRVDFDAVEGRVALTFRPTGIRVLARPIPG